MKDEQQSQTDLITSFIKEFRSRFDQIEQKVDDLNTQIGDLRTRTTENTARITMLDLSTRGVRKDVGALQTQLADHRNKTKIELKKINTNTDDIIDMISSLADSTAPMVDEVEKLKKRTSALEEAHLS